MDEQDQQKSSKTLRSPPFSALGKASSISSFFLQSEQISNAFISAPVTLPRQSRKMQPNGTRWCSSKNGWIFLVGPIFYVYVSAKKNQVSTPQKHGSRGVPWGEPEKTFFSIQSSKKLIISGDPVFLWNLSGQEIQTSRAATPQREFLLLPNWNSIYVMIKPNVSLCVYIYIYTCALCIITLSQSTQCPNQSPADWHT